MVYFEFFGLLSASANKSNFKIFGFMNILSFLMIKYSASQKGHWYCTMIGARILKSELAL